MSRKYRKFKGFFRPKLGDLQKKKKKKKKKVFAKIQSDFSPKFRKFKRLRGGSFRMGGAIFHFSQKIGLKSTKYMRFCILHKPMGGARAPPPLATLLGVCLGNPGNISSQRFLIHSMFVGAAPPADGANFVIFRQKNCRFKHLCTKL